MKLVLILCILMLTAAASPPKSTQEILLSHIDFAVDWKKYRHLRVRLEALQLRSASTTSVAASLPGREMVILDITNLPSALRKQLILDCGNNNTDPICRYDVSGRVGEWPGGWAELADVQLRPSEQR